MDPASNKYNDHYNDSHYITSVISLRWHIVSILKEASKILMNYYNSDDIRIAYKDDNSPVTSADMAAHFYITEQLAKFTIDPIVSEENYKDFDMRGVDQFWLLDPLDGTYGFINKNDQFCICLALISDGKPVLGFIHDPIDNITYISDNEYVPNIISDKYNVVFSHSDFNGAEHKILDEVIGFDGYHEVKNVLSALKFTEMINGNIDIYLRFNPCYEWDSAAGQALLEANNFTLIDLYTNEEMFYNKFDFMNNPFIAYHNDVEESIISDIIDKCRHELHYDTYDYLYA